MDEDKKPRLKMFSTEDVIEQGKATADVGPRTNISIDGGFKCEHGGYIPAFELDRNRAPFCSLCYPYLIKLKE